MAHHCVLPPFIFIFYFSVKMTNNINEYVMKTFYGVIMYPFFFILEVYQIQWDERKGVFSNCDHSYHILSPSLPK